MRQVILLGGLLAVMAGCGGDGLDGRLPIEGVLTAQGSPVPSAIVQFTPKSGAPGEGAIGQSDAEGKFTVISSRQDDSGVTGQVQRADIVVDRWQGRSVPPDATQADHPDAKIDSAPYSTPNSPLEVTIDDKGGSGLD